MEWYTNNYASLLAGIFYQACKEYNGSMKLFIKNMVSIRCKMVVISELEKLNLIYTSVELGEVHTLDIVSAEQLAQLKAALWKSGLELMDDKQSIIIEKIKNVI